jgi:DNA adenine methylase
VGTDEAIRTLQPNPNLTPFLKWPGGKSQELAAIAVVSPELVGRYVDPFVGGGSVLLAVPSVVPAVVNDACRDLIELYHAATERTDQFRHTATALAGAWDGFSERSALLDDLVRVFSEGDARKAEHWLSDHHGDLRALLTPAGPGFVERFLRQASRDLPGKFNRIKGVEAKVGRVLSASDLRANIEGAIRSAFYMSVRARYNEARLAGCFDDTRTVDFLFLREFTYAAMFRFNARDEFNVPYGGVTYNRKSLSVKLDLLFDPRMLARLANTSFSCDDFEPFLESVSPVKEDFVFVDPPYDSDFSDYDNLAFGGSDQTRLRDVLESLPSQVMVVIKDTPMIRRLYGADRWRINSAPKTYMWTIKSRNKRETNHLTITSY